MIVIGTFTGDISEDGTITLTLSPLKDAILEDYPLISQRDPRWNLEKLGDGSTTINDYGCVITSIAMVMSKVYNKYITPVEINTKMKEVNGFTGANKNLFIWRKLEEAFSKLKLKHSANYTSIAAPTDIIDSALKNGNHILVRVDYNLQTIAVNAHWVLIVDKDGNDYIIHDPWLTPADQKKISLLSKYAKSDWSAARTIYSIIVFGEN